MSALIRSGVRGEHAAEFWRRLQAGRLALQRCVSCSAFRFPPGPGCPSCGAIHHTWTEPQTTPEVAAWTVTHPEAAGRLPKRLLAWTPYTLILARFPDVDRILVPALLTGDGRHDLARGAAVALSGGTPEQPQLTAELVAT